MNEGNLDAVGKISAASLYAKIMDTSVNYVKVVDRDNKPIGVISVERKDNEVIITLNR